MCYHKTILTTKFPITTVARKNGTQTSEATHIQSHIDSIHSPHKTRNTIIKLCMKSTKFHRGKSLSGNRSLLSKKLYENVFECLIWVRLEIIQQLLLISMLLWKNAYRHNFFQIAAFPLRRRWIWLYTKQRSNSLRHQQFYP